jgi:hypothetical protein
MPAVGLGGRKIRIVERTGFEMGDAQALSWIWFLKFT